MTFLEQTIRKELEQYPEELREQIYQEVFAETTRWHAENRANETVRQYVLENLQPTLEAIHSNVRAWFATEDQRKEIAEKQRQRATELEAARQKFLALSIPEQLWEVLQTLKETKR